MLHSRVTLTALSTLLYWNAMAEPAHGPRTLAEIDQSASDPWQRQTVIKDVRSHEYETALLDYHRLRAEAASVAVGPRSGAEVVGYVIQDDYAAQAQPDGSVAAFYTFRSEITLRFIAGAPRRVGLVVDARYAANRLATYIAFNAYPQGHPELVHGYLRGEAKETYHGSAFDVLEWEIPAEAGSVLIVATQSGPHRSRRGMFNDFATEYRTPPAERVMRVTVAAEHAETGRVPRLGVEVAGTTTVYPCPRVASGGWLCEARISGTGFMVAHVELPYLGSVPLDDNGARQ